MQRSSVARGRRPFAGLLLLVLAAAGTAQTPPAKPAPGKTAPPPAADAPAPLSRQFPDLSLTLNFPAAWHLTEAADSGDPQVKTLWTGTLGSSALRVRLILFPQGEPPIGEPSEVLDIIEKDLKNPEQGGDRTFHFDDVAQLQGKFGWASYATLATSTEHGKDGDSRVARLGGLLENKGYAIEVRATPAPPAADATALRDALGKSVAYDGPQRDPKWTDAEAKTRWQSDVPDDLKDKLGDILRTPHYIILTNSSGGKAFAKKMEDCYAAIRKVFPFDEVPGRRLMPVFLFRTNDQYYAFLGKAAGMDVESAKRTGGVAFNDLYTTWYEAPGDPVHIHEATHQIFKNRLYLFGGGSWFQEGVAEYMCTKETDRGAVATAVKKGKHVPLPDFVKIESLIFSNTKDAKNDSDEAAADQYQEAGLVIEFVRQSKFGKDKFLDWVRAIGSTPSNDAPAIEAALQRVYHVDLAGFEKEFEDYCKHR